MIWRRGRGIRARSLASEAYRIRAELLDVTEHGQGCAVVFVHGWSLAGAVEASDFEPVFAGLDGWRRLYVDLPGMAGSPALPARDLDDILDLLSDVLNSRLSASESFAVAGTSAGGLLAYGLARRFEARVRGLLLRVPMLEPDPDARGLPQRREDTQGGEAGLQDVYDDPLLPLAFYAASERKRVGLWEPARQLGNEEYLGGFTSYVMPRFASGAQRALSVPALVLVGRQDGCVGYRDALGWLDRLPRATFAVLDRESHLLPADGPVLFHALVLDWLHRVAEVWHS